MFSLTVSDHIMIAHSFRGEEFGPAQKMHGATFVVEVEFRAPDIDGLGLLVDIGLARQELAVALGTLNYQNLDELPEHAGKNTTTEYLCRYIHGLMAAAVKAGKLGKQGVGVSGLKVTLRESPNAWASFEGDV
jgi:6-pyruvoyl-tetrahydropterin synthase